MKYADIILPLNLAKPLTYGVPLEYQAQLMPGMRVEVGLGRNKLYSGVVLQLHNNQPEAFTVKPIRGIIDSAPVVNERQLKFWQWVARYYLCSIGEVMQAALPAHLKLMGETLLLWTGFYETLPTGLSEDAYLAAEAIQVKGQVAISELRQIVNKKNVGRAINELLENQIIVASDMLDDKYRAKTERVIKLAPELRDEEKIAAAYRMLARSPKQEALLTRFFQLQTTEHYVPASLLLNGGNFSSTVLKGLEEKGILVSKQVQVDRIGALGDGDIKDFGLSEAQQVALDQIKDKWEKDEVTLLQGVTGSGKTLIYIQLIKERIADGGQVLYMLPEIALTAHIVGRLKSYFGDELGVYHSGYNNNERVEIWKKVAAGKIKVVIGPRSAIWLPYDNLKLIIVDEEHDSSYKQQEPVPRYHARDAAVYLAYLHRAKVLLGTATPSIESAYNAQMGKYGYVLLTERYRGVALPQIDIVAAGNTQPQLSGILTVDLLSAIQDTLRNGNQVILFQNKRGYAPFMMCASCGWVPHCKNCDVTLTYHKASDKLECHYCGSKFAVVKTCPQCGGVHIVSRNFGTEKVEEELQKIFPKKHIARMDWDSMNTRNKQAQLLEEFTRGRIDILVGTQMVVKGLDFENVNLVGILSGDSLLSYPDFRVNERAFQLMEQVSGRAGRLDGKGKVILQSYKRDHPVLGYVVHHDYSGFYKAEIEYRRHFFYPPFARLIKIICKHRNEMKVQEGANAIVHCLQPLKPTVLIQGPSVPGVARIRNYFIQEIWIKAPNNNKQLQQVKGNIAAAIGYVQNLKGFSGMKVLADVDPV